MWSLKLISIDELRPFLNNPRYMTKHNATHLKESISKFGIIDKPIINSDNTIIGGHQRVTILKEMGYTEIECWMTDRLLTEQEVKELCVRLNRNHGDFDLDILANDFEEEDLLDWGFTEFEIPSAKIGEDDISSEENPEHDADLCPTCNRKLKKKGKNGKAREAN